MKKNYVLLSGLVLSCAFGYSQELKYDHSRVDLRLSAMDKELVVKAPSTLKAAGDTIFYEDFDSTGTGGLPAGWVVDNPLTNGNDWIWNDLPPGGMFSTGAGALRSTTGANGYLQLPCDLYNTPLPASAVAMDVSVISPRINITPTVRSIYLKFEQSQRYCCSGANELVLEVSSDSLNWTTFNATGPAGNKRSPNTTSANAESLEFVVSGVLANQSTAWFRFRSTGNSHYYWQIDDVLLSEGYDNNMRLETFDMNFHNQYELGPIYTILPVNNMPATSYLHRSHNAGAAGNVATNVMANVDIYMDSTLNGGAGTGLVYSASSSVNGGNPIALDERDTTEVTSPFFVFNPGHYKKVLTVTDDSVNQAPLLARQEYLLELNNDTVIALERGDAFYNSDFGPSTYVNGGNNGDIMANMVIIDSSTSFTATSISINVSSRAVVDDVQIAPRIYAFDVPGSIINNGATFDPDSGIGALVGTSPFPFTIDTAIHADQWVTISLLTPTVMGPGAYFFGIEQVGNGPSNLSEIWLNRETDIEKYGHFWQTIVFFASPSTGTPGWASTGSRLPAIRLNGSFTVGLDETKSLEENVKFEVYPNPNDGQFKMKLTATQQANYIMKISNVVGQTVHTEPISVNGTLNKQMDLSAYDKGIYFISLEDGKDRLVKKVIVK